jgi:hypothetical protein
MGRARDNKGIAGGWKMDGIRDTECGGGVDGLYYHD